MAHEQIQLKYFIKTMWILNSLTRFYSIVRFEMEQYWPCWRKMHPWSSQEESYNHTASHSGK